MRSIMKEGLTFLSVGIVLLFGSIYISDLYESSNITSLLGICALIGFPLSFIGMMMIFITKLRDLDEKEAIQ